MFTPYRSDNLYANAIYLLNIASGTLQPELLVPAGSDFFYGPLTWLDEKRVLVESISYGAAGASSGSLFILDTGKGANQHVDDLQHLSDYGGCDSADSSPDGKLLFTSQCHSPPGRIKGPTSISVQSTAGGTPRTIYSSPTLAVQQIRVISSTTLLFIIRNEIGDTSQNGLWKIQTDGSGLTHITAANTHTSIFLNVVSDLWSNVSRDGKMYTLFTSNEDYSANLSFGSLNGGTPTVFASTPPDGVYLWVIGWTTM